MRIKIKLTLSIGTLLAIIILLGLFSARATDQMKRDTENILAENYNSVKYARPMLVAMNLFFSDNTSAAALFSESLALQKNNITESNEHNFTLLLESRFRQFRADPSQQNYIRLSDIIHNIILVNSNATYVKSEIADSTAQKALIWMIVLALLSAVVAVVMLIWVPRSFTRPVKKLIDYAIHYSPENSRIIIGARPAGEVAL